MTRELKETINQTLQECALLAGVLWERRDLCFCVEKTGIVWISWFLNLLKDHHPPPHESYPVLWNQNYRSGAQAFLKKVPLVILFLSKSWKCLPDRGNSWRNMEVSIRHMWRAECNLIIDFSWSWEWIREYWEREGCKGDLSWPVEGLSCQAWACRLYLVNKGQVWKSFV